MSRRFAWVIALALASSSGCSSFLRGDTRQNSDLRELMQVSDAPARPPATFPELILEADRNRDAGRLSQAAWSYLRALRVNPESSLPRERIGLLHLGKGDYERAQTSFQAVITANPESAVAHCGLGLALLHRNELERAETALERARTLAPQETQPLVALGILEDRRGDYARAEQFYREGLSLAPDDPDLHNNLGLSLLMRGEPAQALVHLERAAELDPDARVGRNNLGIALARLHRYDEALEAFRRVGSEAEAQNNLGYVQYLNGEYENAIRHYERALEEHPEANLLIIRNLRQAEAALDRASAVDPPNSVGASDESAVSRPSPDSD